MKKKGKKKEKAKGSWVGGAAELVPLLILAYFSKGFWSLYGQIYPKFPDFDADHRYIEKFQNRIERGEELTLDVFFKESKQLWQR